MTAHPTPQISIVTRTLGHAPFLQRVSASLMAARCDGMEWILVDDSGEAGPALEAAEAAARAGGIAVRRVVSGARHRGRALAAGLAAACGDLIHILDDDDSIEPVFYRQMRAMLLARPEIGALACRCWRIDEEATASGFRETRRRRHYPEIQAISLAAMAVQQLTPTCSLLFRRAALASVGPVDDTLAVCEDYEFLLRFLLKHDIGLADGFWAAFHIRTNGAGAASNSASSLAYAETDAFFRNAMLRRSLREPENPLGWLLTAGEMARGAAKFDRLIARIRTQGLRRWWN